MSREPDRLARQFIHVRRLDVVCSITVQLRPQVINTNQQHVFVLPTCHWFVGKRTRNVGKNRDTQQAYFSEAIPNGLCDRHQEPSVRESSPHKVAKQFDSPKNVQSFTTRPSRFGQPRGQSNFSVFQLGVEKKLAAKFAPGACSGMTVAKILLGCVRLDHDSQPTGNRDGRQLWVTNNPSKLSGWFFHGGHDWNGANEENKESKIR